MLNQIVLVGRLTRDISVYKSEKGKKVATISLAIPRSFKNMEDLLSRRDELFVSSKSDEEIKAFVQDYDKKLWYDQMKHDVRAKVVITGYDAENRPQVKFLSSELLSPNF